MGLATLVLLCLVGCGGTSGGTSDATTPPGTIPPPPPPPPPAVISEIPDLTTRPGTADGEVVLEFTAPSTPAGGTVDGYEIRYQVPHIQPANVDAAAAYANSFAPRPPGTRESLTLTGLREGAILQFCVRAVLGAERGSWSMEGHGVNGVVTGDGIPAIPANAVHVSAGTYSTPIEVTTANEGTYYVLDGDVTFVGTGFRVRANDITINLNGHTLRYNTGGTNDTYGIYMYWMPAATTMICNGSIVHGGGATPTNCSPVQSSEIGTLFLHHVDVTVEARQSSGLKLNYLYGGGIISHCNVYNYSVDVVNRHAGEAGIFIDGVRDPHTVEVHGCTVHASPQWGIRANGTTTGGAWFHHNKVVGTRSYFANAYMLGCYFENGEFWENYVSGESRGLHVGGPNVRVHDNHVVAREHPNAEYPGLYWCHGVKYEGAVDCKTYHNVIEVTADDAQARALDIGQLENSPGNEISHNLVRALAAQGASASRRAAIALHLTEAAPGFGLSFVHHNVLQAADHFVDGFWDIQSGAVFGTNLFGRLPGGVDVRTLFVWMNPAHTCTGWGSLDWISPEDFATGANLATNATFTWDVKWSLTVRATEGGAGAAGALVSVRDAGGALQFSGTAGADGRVSGVVRAQRLASGAVPLTTYGPFTVSVQRGTKSYSGDHAVSGVTAVEVDLDTGTGVLDAAPPTAPGKVRAFALGASRARVAWDASDDASGVVAYRILRAGAVVGFTAEREFVLAGLTPASTYDDVLVEAMDAGGLWSAPTAVPAFTTPAEDRGAP